VLGLPGEHPANSGIELVPSEQLAHRCDLLISLGGDGTMLRSLRLAFGSNIPVLGVNVGKLGFLAEADVPELADALLAVSAGRFEVEQRVAVEARVEGKVRTAFNDVALVRSPGHAQAAVALHVEGRPFVRYVADALVVATPTGSTAYSFSAGGPIVSPRIEGLLLVPVAPHSSFNRALMLSCSETLALELLDSSGELGVELDGELVATAHPGQRIDLVTHLAAGSVVRLGWTTFFQRAQRKLRLPDAAELL
jgi:NAD+ kinase